LSPAEDFGQSMDVAVDHLLLGGPLASRLIHDDEAVLVIAPGEQQRHLRRRAVTETGTAPRAGAQLKGE
ncbi:hypothetical protein B296_00056907, partial [Ensete ventricosum]